jgi:lipopolysaccharide transport system ATP-binding protein
MSSDIAIAIEGLSKRYLIGHHSTQRERYSTLRDVVTREIRNYARNTVDFLHGRQIVQGDEVEEFWALEDVSFEVKQGEVLGIIGRNGAGKSTLLKILSRITEPDRGRVRLRGRVSSLLEVGTGFHPELTGRENIYLNGAILGMKKAEIARKFDEIVAFSEMERFLDTPVKQYSSGMYVRLAFAVAAHLEPEILIVDEVLAVGDVAFQEKCLGKLDKVAHSDGRTVLFVSHSMGAIQQLCSRAIVLRGGRLVADAEPTRAISEYISQDMAWGSISLRDWNDRVTNGQATITHFAVCNQHREPVHHVAFGQSVQFSMSIEFHQPVVRPVLGILVHSAAGEPILDLRSIHAGIHLECPNGCLAVTAQANIEQINLYPGDYTLSPFVYDETTTVDIDWVRHCCKLQVVASAADKSLKLDPKWGKVFTPSSWTILENKAVISTAMSK